MIYLFGLGLFIIIMIGVLGCIATIEETEYQNYKWRYEDETKS